MFCDAVSLFNDNGIFERFNMPAVAAELASVQ